MKLIPIFKYRENRPSASRKVQLSTMSLQCLSEGRCNGAYADVLGPVPEPMVRNSN